MMRLYIFIWLAISLFLAHEFIAMNTGAWHSVLQGLSAHGHIPFQVSSTPGRTLSLWLGWIGLGLMIVMNVYSLRKRAAFLNGLGKLSNWLNFHIFCGLLGPTFILFHCNFKVRGLVGISFWSMVVSFSSGVIGRYFYLQIVMAKADFRKDGEKWLNRLKRYLQQNKIEWDQEAYGPFLQEALAMAGAQGRPDTGLSTIWHAFWGDMRLRFFSPAVPTDWPDHSEVPLEEYAVSMRRAETLESFQRFMGYWHAFHFPFAIFMYVAAAVHVTASLIFGY
jgi:hypothetical protein